MHSNWTKKRARVFLQPKFRISWRYFKAQNAWHKSPYNKKTVVHVMCSPTEGHGCKSVGSRLCLKEIAKPRFKNMSKRDEFLPAGVQTALSSPASYLLHFDDGVLPLEGSPHSLAETPHRVPTASPAEPVEYAQVRKRGESASSQPESWKVPKCSAQRALEASVWFQDRWMQ